MAKYVINEASLVAIADEVREMEETTEKVSVGEMITTLQEANEEIAVQTELLMQAVEELEGKVDPELYKSGYAEGYDTGFADGTDESGVDVLVSRTITNYRNDRVTSIGQSAFYFCSVLESVAFQNVTIVGNYAFRYCAKLKHADFPNLTTIGVSVFEYCYSLTTLILRAETVCSLRNTSAFNHCYHILGTVNASYNPDGLKDGYIYVPDNLVDSYKTATNWSTYATQIKPISELGV